MQPLSLCTGARQCWRQCCHYHHHHAPHPPFPPPRGPDSTAQHCPRRRAGRRLPRPVPAAGAAVGRGLSLARDTDTPAARLGWGGGRRRWDDTMLREGGAAPGLPWRTTPSCTCTRPMATPRTRAPACSAAGTATAAGPCASGRSRSSSAWQVGGAGCGESAGGVARGWGGLRTEGCFGLRPSRWHSLWEDDRVQGHHAAAA